MFMDMVQLWEDSGGDPDFIRNELVRVEPHQIALGLGALWENPPKDYYWPHLIYAYAVENTRIYEIFRRTIGEFLNGEKLGSPSDDAQQWIQTTADLFYKMTPPFTPWSLDNHVRPNLSAIRRNAYYRMFGMDLNHAPAKGEEYRKTEEHNDGFVHSFERLLQEVWTGYRNRANAVGTNPTDDSAIAFMCTKIHQMMAARRQGNNLSREEFFSVAMLSWLHLAVDFNSPIVESANAASSSAHERLRLLGEKVGMPAHGKSEHFFEFSQPASRLLLRIEAGEFNDAANARLLYDESDTITYDVQDLVTHWSLATGRDMKATNITMAAQAQ